MKIIKIDSGASFSLYERFEDDICKVSEYLSELEENAQKQILALFAFILEEGLPTNIEKVKYVGDYIYELKAPGFRIMCFPGDPVLPGSLILTYGFSKPKQKILREEKEKAEEWRKEYFDMANKNNNYNIVKKQNGLKGKLKGLKGDFEFRLEMLILSLTERFCERMEQKNTSRSKLAKMLNVSPAAVTKILNGNNFTLRTLLSLADTLDAELMITFRGKASEATDDSSEASDKAGDV